MKDAEDEAFDELAKRQGHWGGGYQAKKAMAADKLQEPTSGDYALGYAEGFNDACKKPAQEPVTTVTSESGNPDVTMSWWHEPPLPVGTPLYTYPPQRPWVGLTDEEIRDCLGSEAVRIPPGWSRLTRAIEAKLKEKNNGT
jgi:hypothetical protein